MQENSLPLSHQELFNAIENNDLKHAESLLLKGCDVNARDRFNYTPLMRAAIYGNLTMASLLLNFGADVRAFNSSGDALCLAAYQLFHPLNYDLVELLVHAGAAINQRDSHGNTALHKAVSGSHVRVVQLLCKTGFDVNALDNTGHSPLHNAACLYSIESSDILRVLYEWGADLNLYNNDGMTPIAYALLQGNNTTVKLLLSWGADVNASANRATKPIALAAKYRNYEIVELLLDNGASIRDLVVDNNQVEQYVDLGTFIKNMEKYLFYKRLITGDTMNYNSGSLFAAIACGDYQSVYTSIQNGANVNLNDGLRGITPLLLACEKGKLPIVQLLIKSGADTNAVDNRGRNALMKATQYNHAAVVIRLLALTFAVNAKDQYGDTALSMACEDGHTEIATILIQSNADLNTQNECGLTPLMLAARNGHTATVKILIEKNADTFLVDDWGRSAIIHAHENAHIEVVRLLQEKGVILPEYCNE